MDLFYNYSFDSARDGGYDLVWDGAEDTCEFGNSRIFTEDRHCVSDLDVKTCHIQHAHVHADVTDGRHPMAVDGEAALAATEVTVYAICISDRNGRDDSAFWSNLSVTAIAYCTVRRAQSLDLQNLTLE